MSNDICQNCEGPIQIAIFKGTGFCSEWCRKGIARFRPDAVSTEDQPIPELVEIRSGDGLVLSQIDPATIIYDTTTDLNSLLAFCDLEHVGVEYDTSGYTHSNVDRLCVRLNSTHEWVYDPGWEKMFAQEKAAAMHEQAHEH